MADETWPTRLGRRDLADETWPTRLAETSPKLRRHLAGDAVQREPVSSPYSLLTGKYIRTDQSRYSYRQNEPENWGTFDEFPCTSEQGISGEKTGNKFSEQGIYPIPLIGLRLWRRQ